MEDWTLIRYMLFIMLLLLLAFWVGVAAEALT